MDVNDQLSVFELYFQSFVLSSESSVLSGLRVGFATSFSRSQALEFAALALLPPVCEMRGVQVFPTEQRAHFATLCAGVSFRDASLVLSGEVPAFGSDSDFRVRHIGYWLTLVVVEGLGLDSDFRVRLIHCDTKGNTKSSPFAGFVTQFEVEQLYAERFEVHTVGNRTHQELWVPAEELAEFNRHIIGRIKVVASYNTQ